MKKMMRVWMAALVALVMVGVTGCAGIAEHLAKDNATVKSDLNTVYGKHHLVRSNPQLGQDVVISPDGTITIKTSEHWRPGAVTNAPAPVVTEKTKAELRKLLE